MYRLSPFIVTYWPEIHSGALVRSEAKVRHAVREVQKRSLKACTAIAFPQFVFAIPLSLICHLFAIWLSFVCQQFVICSYVQYVLFLCQLFIALSFVFDLLAIPLSSLCHFCCFFLIPLSFLVLLFPFACDFRCWGQVQGNVRSLWQLVVGRNHPCICMPVRAIQMSTGVVEFQNKVEVPAAILISASKDVHTHTDVPKCAALAEYGITARCHMATDLRIYADDRAAVVVRANSG